MKAFDPNLIHEPRPARTPFLARGGGFTLIEILVVMALLSIIVLGLLAMFTQTQKAFRTGLTQTDVLQSGRMLSDLMAREIAQITPTQLTTNFYVWYPTLQPLEQPLPGSTFSRTNMIEDLFFVTRRNREWVGIGYFVRNVNQLTGAILPAAISFGGNNLLAAGTLYRCEFAVSDVPPLYGPDYLYRLYSTVAYANTWPINNPNFTNVAKIVEGVVHFKVRTYNTNGSWIVENWGTNGVSYSGFQTNAEVRFSSLIPGEIGQYLFYSNAVPAAVELEFGLLEDKAWERYKRLPTDAAKYTYITNIVGRVHLFRQRVQVRNVDPVAYQ